MNYSASGEDESDSKENIYEEIKDKADDDPEEAGGKESRKSSSSEENQQTKSKFQKALEAVTRRSSREIGSEKSFHLSISKGRKKSLIDKAKVDWDCYGPPGLATKLNKSSSDMLGDVNSSHDRVMSQLKLDVEVRKCGVEMTFALLLCSDENCR